jgi:hypothetical protein
MLKKWYIIEWNGTDPWGNDYSDRQTVYTEVEAQQLIFHLAHKEGIRTIYKNTVEEIEFRG